MIKNPIKKRSSKIKIKSSKQLKKSAIIVVAFAVIGSALYLISKAATTNVSFEAESGTKSAKVKVLIDQNSDASGNSYIKFSASECGNKATNYSYQVPFGTAPWNKITCDLPSIGNSLSLGKAFGKKLYDYGIAWNAGSQYWQDRIDWQKGQFATQFGLAGDENDYGTPIYYADANTPKRQFMICEASTCYPSDLDHGGWCPDDDINCFAPNAYVPFEESWRAAGDSDENIPNNATDKEMIIVDKSTGYVYELGQLDRVGGSCIGTRRLWYSLAGRNPDTRICVSGIHVIRDNNQNKAQYLTFSQGTTAARGMGIQNAAMIVTPEEVAQGEIRHALTMELTNSAFGDICNISQLSTTDNAILNKACAYSVAPAAVVEWKSTPTRIVNDIARGTSCTGMADSIADWTTKTTFRTLFTKEKMLPEGMRFRLTWDDAQIESWLDQRVARYAADPTNNPYDKGLEKGTAKRKTTKIFAVALRDYGWIIGDTTCGGAGFTIAGAANFAGTKDASGNTITGGAKKQWADLGISDSTSQLLLLGLFKADNIDVVEPPTNHCLDGTTTKFMASAPYETCGWTSSEY